VRLKWLQRPVAAARRALRSIIYQGISLADHDLARRLFGYRPTLSGVAVTEQTALEAPAYFAGVRNVSEDLATLPLILYRKLDEDRRERANDDPLYPLLHDQPNEECDSVQFIETMQAWLMTRRNAYAEIVRDGAGRVTSLWPYHPSMVTIIRVEGELYFRVDLPPGELDPVTGQTWSTLRRDQVLHIKAFALDGVCGMSSTELHREAIGRALALEQYGAAFFGNDATPGGTYETPGVLSPEGYARLKAELEEKGGRGLTDKHRIMILEQGLKFSPSAVPNDKAQFIESERNSTEQMARINRVPPHMIGDLSRATFSNIEHQGIDYVTHSIRPYAVRWEKAIFTQVLTQEQRRTLYAEFLFDALLRADAVSRATALNILRQNGVINADEWRKADNRDPTADGSGKVYLVNGSMVPVSEAGRPQQKPALPDPSAPPPPPARADAERLFRPLFRAAAERCIRKEAAAVGKAVDRVLKPAGLRAFEAWTTDFYKEQQHTVREAWMPLAVAVAEAVRGEQGPDISDWAMGYTQRVADARSRAAIEELRTVIASGSSDMPGALRGVTERWAKEAAERMAGESAAALVEGVRKHLAATVAA
jgi:HK97 family phage portal protein